MNVYSSQKRSVERGRFITFFAIDISGLRPDALRAQTAVVYDGCDELNRGMADFSVDELRS